MMLKSYSVQTTDHINKTALVTFCSLLGLSKKLDNFSQLLTILVIGIGMIASWWFHAVLLSIFCAVIFIIGVIAKYYALRLSLDKTLFDYLSQNPEQLSEILLELDEALVSFNLIKPNSQSPRTFVDRQHGTIQLLKKQLIMLIIQLLLLIVTLLTGIFLQ